MKSTIVQSRLEQEYRRIEDQSVSVVTDQTSHSNTSFYKSIQSVVVMMPMMSVVSSQYITIWDDCGRGGWGLRWEISIHCFSLSLPSKWSETSRNAKEIFHLDQFFRLLSVSTE